MSRPLLFLVLVVPTAILLWERLPVAHAESPPSDAVCMFEQKWATQRGADSAAAFMTAQIQAGRTRFTPYGSGILCAW